jgi:tetratricopeptide (TPR) repeat protein
MLFSVQSIGPSPPSWIIPAPRRGLRGYAEHKRQFDQTINDEIASQRRTAAGFAKAIKIDPDNALGYYNRGRAHFDEGDFPNAISDYSEAIKRNRKFAEAYIGRGAARFYTGDLTAALLDFEEVLAREPVAIALFNKGATLGALGRGEQAIAVYDDLLGRFEAASEFALPETVAKALFNKGVELGTLDRSEQAIAVYDDLLARFEAASELALREQVAGVLVNKGVRLYALGRSEQAIAVYDDVLRRFEAAPELALREQVAGVLVNKGVALGALDRREQAIAVYDDVLRRFEAASELALRDAVGSAFVNKGASLYALGRSEQAIAVYDALLARFEAAPELALPEQVAVALLNKGLALGALRRSEEAIAVYDDVLRRFEAAPELAVREQVARALRNKGVRLGALGHEKLINNEFNEASDLFRWALQCNPALGEVVQKSIEVEILKYYNLTLQDLENLSDKLDLPITMPDVKQLMSETAALLTENLREAEEKPFKLPTKRDVAAIIAHGKKFSWDTRTERGWPYHANAFKYLHVTYACWIGRGLTRDHIASADKSLAAHLRKKISMEGMPKWLDVPTGAEARLRATTDAMQRGMILGVREFFRKQKQRYRSRKATLGD